MLAQTGGGRQAASGRLCSSHLPSQPRLVGDDQPKSQPNYRCHHSSRRPPSPLPGRVPPCTPALGSAPREQSGAVLRRTDARPLPHAPHHHSHGAGQEGTVVTAAPDLCKLVPPEDQLLKWTRGQEPGADGGSGRAGQQPSD